MVCSLLPLLQVFGIYQVKQSCSQTPLVHGRSGNVAGLLLWEFLRILQSFLLVDLRFYYFHGFIHLEVSNRK